MEDTAQLSALREELCRTLGRQRYDLWVGPHTSLEYNNTELRVGCPSQFEMQWLRRRLHDTLVECAHKVVGSETKVRYYVDAASHADETSQLDEPQDEDRRMLDSENNPSDSDPDLLVTQQAGHTSASGQSKARSLRSLSTFSSFVMGKGNELAYRTAKAVVDQPGHYGPLLLFGPPGVGKTHLQCAMLQHLRRSSRRKSSLRLTAEQFTSEFLDSLNRRVLPSFRQKYRTIDVLLIDDIHFLLGKRATVEELVFTIDTLQESGHQVVLTSDRSPGELQKISGELVSRISGGLSIPIEPPEYATRVGIVRQLASRKQISLDEKVVALVATQVVGSARQLGGAINRLQVTSEALGEPITLDRARVALTEFVQQNAPAVRLTDIQRAVCEVFGVGAASLKSNQKKRSVAEPRMLAMWLARKYTRAALGEISEFFGRRSHSTVISAQRKIEGLVSQNAEISVADRPCRVEEAIRQVESVLRTA